MKIPNHVDLTGVRIGNNVVCCKGKIVMGMVFGIILISIPTVLILYLLFYLINSKENEFITLVIIIILKYITAVTSMLIAGCRDPGIFARKMEDDFLKIFDDRKSAFRVNVRGSLLKLSKCYTCNIIRPPRTSHCAECDNCIEKFDHHCIWIGNCVGKRNYKFFILLLFVVNAMCIFQMALALGLTLRQTDAKLIQSEDTIMIMVICQIIVIFNGLFFYLFLWSLFSMHFKLMIQNITFYEHVKKKWENRPGKNPFDKFSFWNNIKFNLFSKIPYPHLTFSKHYNEVKQDLYVFTNINTES